MLRSVLAFVLTGQTVVGPASTPEPSAPTAQDSTIAGERSIDPDATEIAAPAPLQSPAEVAPPVETSVPLEEGTSPSVAEDADWRSCAADPQACWVGDRCVPLHHHVRAANIDPLLVTERGPYWPCEFKGTLEARRNHAMVNAGLAMGGVGLAGLVTMVVGLVLMGSGTASQDMKEAGRWMAIGAGSGGGTLLVAGLTVFGIGRVRERDRLEHHYGGRLLPTAWIAPRGGGLSLRLRF